MKLCRKVTQNCHNSLRNGLAPKWMVSKLVALHGKITHDHHNALGKPKETHNEEALVVLQIWDGSFWIKTQWK